MPAAAIEVTGLGKAYRRLRGGQVVAVDELNLVVPEGGVFGFLGPNGSGKTTTIRCLLGLIKPSKGACRVLGASVRPSLHQVIRRVGTVSETPTFIPNFTGRKNLQLLASVYGISDRTVDEMLERVGLGIRGRDRVKAYSLGMRQRLGLAAALLKDPALLILDEPANGLDPAGIREVRQLIRGLGKEGRTIFLSSHLLSEIEQTCDSVAILSRGRCIRAGSVAEVLSTGQLPSVIVRVEDSDSAQRLLRDNGYDVLADARGLVVTRDDLEPAALNQLLGSAGLWASEIRSAGASLEDVFLQLTEGPDEVS